MAYRVLVAAVVGVHFAYLAFVVIGGFLAWRWRRVIWVHVAAVAWGLAIVAVPGLLCPLTTAENWARHRAGMPFANGGFINQYVENVIYPARYTPIVQVVIGSAVAVSWIGGFRIAARHRAPHATTTWM
jgi:hypothetical protein